MGVRRLGLVLAAVVWVAAGVAVTPPASASAPPAADARLTFGDTGSARVGRIGPLPYDGRAGVVFASLTDAGDGRFALHAASGDVSFAPVRLMPHLPFVPLAIDVVPMALDGEIDLCAGSVRLELTAGLQPSFAPHVSVRTTVELVSTAAIDAFGTVPVAGTAGLAGTGNRLVDSLLGLPGPLELVLPLHLDLPADTPHRCAAEQPGTGSGAVRMVVLASSRLLISRFPPFPYDGKGSGGTGTARDVAVGRYDVAFAGSDLSIPPVRLVPGLDAIRVDIITDGIAGTVDTGTGAVDLAFDASFQPAVGNYRPSPISVVTDLTTGESSGYFRHVTGDPMDAWGDVHLVGVAQVPRTGDVLVDWLLALPTDAVADLRVHLDIAGGR
ncbi:MAG: hypothetical protein K1X95_12425 [Acidimicrobiia bacterium]|nr:hypothetical protein [Acidimicrobiia bacterium]